MTSRLLATGLPQDAGDAFVVQIQGVIFAASEVGFEMYDGGARG